VWDARGLPLTAAAAQVATTTAEAPLRHRRHRFTVFTCFRRDTRRQRATRLCFFFGCKLLLIEMFGFKVRSLFVCWSLLGPVQGSVQKGLVAKTYLHALLTTKSVMDIQDTPRGDLPDAS